jgi:hypothetical protein
MFACPEHLVDVLDKGKTNYVRHIGLFRQIMEALGLDSIVRKDDSNARPSRIDGMDSRTAVYTLAGERHDSAGGAA